MDKGYGQSSAGYQAGLHQPWSMPCESQSLGPLGGSMRGPMGGPMGGFEGGPMGRPMRGPPPGFPFHANSWTHARTGFYIPPAPDIPSLWSSSARHRQEIPARQMVDTGMSSPPGALSSQAPPSRGQMQLLPASTAAWIRSGGLLRLHARLLREPQSMTQQENKLAMLGVHVSGDVDFGVHNLCTLPPVGRTEGPSVAQLVQSCWCREVTVKNSGSSSVWLLATTCIPERAHCVTLLDDHRLAQQQPAADPVKGVLLLPGQEYPVTVVLHLDPQVIRNKQDVGILGNFLLLTIWTDCEGLLNPQERRPLDLESRVAVASRKVGLALIDRHPDLSVSLSPKAVPYVPKDLLMLFDSHPSVLHTTIDMLWALYGKEKTVGSLRLRSHVHNLHPSGWQRQGQLAEHPGPICLQRAWDQDRASKTMSDAFYIAADPTPIIPFLHMLAAEEAAMERDCIRSSQFNTRVRCAKLSCAWETYAVQDWPGVAPGPGQANAGQQKQSKANEEPSSFFRGPRLPQLYPRAPSHGFQNGHCMLAVLDVPGLLEGRPSLVIGDAIYIRLTSDPDKEYLGRLLGVEQSRCFLIMPPQWWTSLTSLKKTHGSATPAQPSTWPSLSQAHIQQKPQDGLPPAPLCNVRFTFDRTPFQRMHSGLQRALSRRHLLQLCPQEIASGPAYQTSLAQRMSTPHHQLPEDLEECPLRLAASQLSIKGSTQLNAEQRLAIASMMGGAGQVGHPPFILYGPPGTGKTVTLVECVLQLLQDPCGQPAAVQSIRSRQRAHPRLLLCAPQNYSADLICSSLRKAGLTPSVMARLQDPRRKPAEAKEDVLAFSGYDEESSTFRLPDPYDLAKIQVVVCSCFSAGFLTEGDYARLPTLGSFDFVLIDEAGQASLPESVIPASLADQQWGAVMLCGDPCQLEPVVRSVKAKAMGLGVSLLETISRQHCQGGDVKDIVMLTRNYRSHARLLDLPSRMFYGASLVPCADSSSVQPIDWKELRKANDAPLVDAAGQADDAEQLATSECNMLFYGARGTQVQEGDTHSFCNPIEAATVADLVYGLINPAASDGQRHARVSAKEVGVICTYRKQVQTIRLLLRKRGLGVVRVGTVDDYQGQEERVVFISTVLSSSETLPTMHAEPSNPSLHGWTATSLHQAPAEHGWGNCFSENLVDGTGNKSQFMANQSGGFWSNPKRFNVAITRSRALLVVVGHPYVLYQDTHWRELLRHCAARGLYRGAGQAMMDNFLRLHDDVHFDFFKENWDANVEDATDEDVELRCVVEQIAELALLGVGDVSRMFPSTMDEYEMAMSEEVPSRIAL